MFAALAWEGAVVAFSGDSGEGGGGCSVVTRAGFAGDDGWGGGASDDSGGGGRDGCGWWRRWYEVRGGVRSEAVLEVKRGVRWF